jgi:hypothetical protein
LDAFRGDLASLLPTLNALAVNPADTVNHDFRMEAVIVQRDIAAASCQPSRSTAALDAARRDADEAGRTHASMIRQARALDDRIAHAEAPQPR